MTQDPHALVPVAHVRTGLEAAALIAVLRSGGVEGASADVAGTELFSTSLGSVKVLVRAADLGRARAVLERARGDRAADFDFSGVDSSPREPEPPAGPLRSVGWRRRLMTLGIVITACGVGSFIFVGFALGYLPRAVAIIGGVTLLVGVVIMLSSLMGADGTDE